MSPEGKRNFEAEWPQLSRRLRCMLARKGVPSAQHDDLVQETALRLLSMWDSVDVARPLWPLTATIGLNLLRDRHRAPHKDDLVAQLPEVQEVHDVEDAGIARLELDRVHRALEQLSGAHRSILMKEIGGLEASAQPDSAGEKMMRMRARRKLRSALEKVSGLVALRLRRLMEIVESIVAVREGAVGAVSCAFCLVLGGLGGAASVPFSVTEAGAGTLSETHAGRVIEDATARALASEVGRISSARDGAEQVRREAVLIRARAGRGTTSPGNSGEQGTGSGGTTDGGDELVGVPLPIGSGGGDDGGMGTGSTSVSAQRPPLPGDDGAGGGPLGPPTPATPQTPAPPKPGVDPPADSSLVVVDEAKETASDAADVL